MSKNICEFVQRAWGTRYCRSNMIGDAIDAPKIPEACLTDTAYVLMDFAHNREGHGAARLVGDKGQVMVISTHRSRVPISTAAVPRGPMRGEGHVALYREPEGRMDQGPVTLTSEQVASIVMGGRDY